MKLLEKNIKTKLFSMSLGNNGFTHGSASSHTEKKGKEELVASGRNTAVIALFKLQHLKYLLLSPSATSLSLPQLLPPMHILATPSF